MVKTLFFEFRICHVLSFQMSRRLSIFRDDKFLTLSVEHPSGNAKKYLRWDEKCSRMGKLRML